MLYKQQKNIKVAKLRFNKRNWIRYFDGSNKKTTIRLKKSKIGHHKAYAGSYYHPELLGEFDITKVEERIFKDLTGQDAKDDGFDNLFELQTELVLLNGNNIKNDNTLLYKHWTENVKRIIRDERTRIG